MSISNPIDSTQLNKLAALAKLELTENETTLYTAELNQILKFVDQIHAVSTEHITPMAHPFASTQRMREDVAHTESKALTQYQSIAPHVVDNFYLVPKVIES